LYSFYVIRPIHVVIVIIINLLAIRKRTQQQQAFSARAAHTIAIWSV